MSLKLSLAKRTLDNVTAVLVSFNGFKSNLDLKSKKPVAGPKKVIDYDKFYSELPNIDLLSTDIENDDGMPLSSVDPK